MQLRRTISVKPLKKLVQDRFYKPFTLDDSDIGLVLSGGGARGAYQIGVWKAMKEANVIHQVKKVFGTSVGAINGAAFAQGDFKLAEQLWKELHYSRVFHNYSEIAASAEYKPRAIYQVFVKLIKEKGFNVEPLKELLYEYLDEQKIRKSKIDFGLVVFDVSTLKPKYLKKEDIPDGELIDYIIASATFPLFKAHYIDGVRYLDGGLSDNRPFRFFKDDESIKQAICIDLTTARHFYIKDGDCKNLRANYIKASRLLGSPLAFDIQKIERNMKLGYTDFFKQVVLG